MNKQIETISKDIEIIKSNQVENLELKIMVAKMKNSPERFDSSFEQVEEIGQLKNSNN